MRHPSVSVAAPSSYGRASPMPMLCDEVRMRRAANTRLTRSRLLPEWCDSSGVQAYEVGVHSNVS